MSGDESVSDSFILSLSLPLRLTLRPHHPPSNTHHPFPHSGPPSEEEDRDSGVHHRSPSNLLSSQNTVIVTAECH